MNECIVKKLLIKNLNNLRYNEYVSVCVCVSVMSIVLFLSQH